MTRVTRRAFASGIGAAALMTAAPPLLRAADPQRVLRLEAAPGKALLLEQGQPLTDVWAYNGTVPGPVLRTPQGERFRAEVVNGLNQPTTVHWHGIRIDNRMDGVAVLTQPPIEPGGSFTYDFVPPDAGTYWYHPHFKTWEQLARGLHGVFIVEEQNPPPVDQDLVMLFDDWRLGEDGAIDESTFGSMHDISHAGRLGNILTINGQYSSDFAVLAGQRLRLRLVNAANARIMAVSFEAHVPIVVALDGQPLKTPFAPDGNRIHLTPAQRADVILDCSGQPGTSADIVVDVGRERLNLGRLAYHPSKRQRASVLTDLPILPSNPMPVDLDLDNAVPLNLAMTGGARAPFESAEYKGRRMGVRELVRDHKKAWAFNGLVGLPEKPLAQVPLGRTVVIRMVNETTWPHAMHFHGHHVREIAHSARPPEEHWRDTVFMRPKETVTVAFKAHNPGKWMLHCHMLEHQRGGMSTWYEVG